MKKKLNYFFVILISMVLVGCLTTRTQLREQNRLQSDVATLQENKAEYEARNQEVENQMRDFNGRIEVLELKAREIRDSFAKKEDQSKLDAELLENKFKFIQEALVKIDSELQRLSNEISNVKKNQSTKAATSPSSTSSPGNYVQAEKDFANKKWKEAAVGYQKYRDLNPKGKNYADATYKIGVCFQEMGMKSEAKAFFEEAMERYPSTRTAEKAKYRLKTLK